MNKKGIACSPWLLALILFITSCSTNKEMSSLRIMSANHIIREVDDSRFDIDNLEAKLDIKVKGDNNMGLKGQLRMQNDSLLWVSVSLKLGVEVARAIITEDSVKFINRANKTYLSESIAVVKEMLPVDVSLRYVQDVLVGNDILLRRTDRYKVSLENGMYKLESDRDESMSKVIWITPKTFKISQYEMYGINVRYDDFEKIGKSLMPTKIILESDDMLDISVEIDYFDIKVGEPLTFPFNITKKYKNIIIH